MRRTSVDCAQEEQKGKSVSAIDKSAVINVGSKDLLRFIFHFPCTQRIYCAVLGALRRLRVTSSAQCRIEKLALPGNSSGS